MTRKLTLLRENELTSAASFQDLWSSINNDEWFSYILIFAQATGKQLHGYRDPEDTKYWNLHARVVSKLKLALDILNEHFEFHDEPHPYIDGDTVEKLMEHFKGHSRFRDDAMLGAIVMSLLVYLRAFAAGLTRGDKIVAIIAINQISFETSKSSLVHEVGSAVISISPQDAYREYTALAHIWRNAFGNDETLRSLLAGHSEQNLVPEGKQRLGDSALKKALDLRSVIQHMGNQRQGPEHTPIFLDVYDLALDMQIHSWLVYRPESLYYRGQRRGWPTTPSIFRLPKDVQTLTEDELNHRKALLATFLQALECAYPGKYTTEEQRIAIAQHYGQANEHHMGLYTWLLDLTTDPFVALFFASLHGEENDMGTVTTFSRHEWQFLSSGGHNPFGDMRTIEVPGALRVERQRALFLDTPHPNLIEQYIAQVHSFHQQRGLFFEDPARGITKDQLLPSEDEDALLQWAQHWEPPSNLSQHQWPRVSPHMAQPLEGADYKKIVDGWIAVSNNPNAIVASQSQDVQHLLTHLCEFHAKLQKVPERIPLLTRCIWNLRSATEFILGVRDLNMQRIVHQCYGWGKGDTSEDVLWVLWEELAAVEE